MSSKNDPDTEAGVARVRESFEKQGLMKHLGADLTDARPGFCEITMPYREELSQQHGFFHAGGLAAIIDNAGGYAAYSLFGPDDGVLTVEFKINCMAPAKGEKAVARAEVVRAGRTLTVTKGEVVVVNGREETVCALMQQTIMRIVGRDDVKG